jgi:preprotein translocase subunit SecE
LGKVTWPSREQAQNLTIVVIAVSVAVGIFLGAVDWVFAKIFEFLLQLA